MTVFRRFLLDRRRAAIWWAVGVLGLVAFTVAFWPSVRGQASFDEVVQQLPDAMRAMFGMDQAVSIGSAPGYLHGRVFATMLPLVLIINAIGVGAASIGGAEADGSLELVLSNPVSRRRLYAERTLAALGLTALPAVVAAVCLVVLGAPVGLLDGVSVTQVLTAALCALALALLFGSTALALGAATGRRTIAVAVAAGWAVGGYLVQGLLTAAKAPDVLLALTPWHWYLQRNLLIEAVPVSAVVAPLVLSALLLGLGAVLFERRDLR